MKKTIVFIALFASVVGDLRAQDTVWMKPGPLSNYFNNTWIDTTQRWTGALRRPVGRHVVARQFITEDTLQVYGIAAMMMNEWQEYLKGMESPAAIQAHFNHDYPEDPTLDNCKSSLILYQYHGNGTPVMQQLGDSLHIHTLDTVPSYIVMSNTQPYNQYWDPFPKPVYERYFSEPQTVTDTFYAGNTVHFWDFVKVTLEMGVVEEIAYPVRPFFVCVDVEPVHNNYGGNEAEAHLVQWARDSACRWEFRDRQPTLRWARVIFPILTPNPETDTTVVNDTTVVIDTTVIDTTHVDTVAIRLPEFMGRYVSVSPNPATGSAEVLSSFGLRRVEVFNAAGRKMMDLKAEGLKATLDVSKLPSGAYLLRIHTPQGMTTKKLVVR